MSFRVLPLALITVLALAAGGCGGSDDSSDQPSATVSAQPATGDAVKGTGYTFNAPEGWHKPSKKVAGFDPDALIYDTKDKDGFADNLNVIRTDPAPVNDTDAMEKGSVNELKAIHAANIKVLDRQKVDDEVAVHLTSSLSQNSVKYVASQFAMIHDKVVYVITFSFSPTVTKQHQDAIAQSVMTTWKWAS